MSRDECRWRKMWIRISGGSRAAWGRGAWGASDGDEAFGSCCILDHCAGDAATGSGETKNADLLKSSSSLSSDTEVVDCAGEDCLYSCWRLELDGVGSDLIVVGDNEAGGTWRVQGQWAAIFHVG